MSSFVVVCSPYRFDHLPQSGVRWVYRVNNTFSDTVEPENVAFNEHQTQAYISLQVTSDRRDFAKTLIVAGTMWILLTSTAVKLTCLTQSYRNG